MRFSAVLEDTLGVTPDNPRMRVMTLTGEGLRFVPNFVQSDAIRDDEMNDDPIKVNETNEGPINYEFAYPADQTTPSNVLQSLFRSTWVNTPFRDNDGVADSAITDVTASTGVVTVANGSTFAVGHLVRTTGFGNAANNGLNRCTTASATVPAFSAATLADEGSPAAGARMKVVGFEGASGDIEAVADGLESTTLDFTTLGLLVGGWIKIGGTGAGFRFGTAACNNWARVIAIAQHKLTLDNLPTGWATDAGTGKTVRVFFGDQLKNGVTRKSLTVERGFLGQDVPSYIIQGGMVAGQGEFTFATEQKITAQVTFSGLSGQLTTTPLDASPDPAPREPIMASNVNVGRIAEGGVAVAGPNFIRSASISINRNLRVDTAVGHVGGVDIGNGGCDVSVSIETFFGSGAMLTKLLEGTPSNINIRAAKNGRATIFAVPRLTFTDGSPSAGAKNQRVTVPLQSMASMDPLTNAHIILDRLEYWEN
jgi:hypothetical protein